MVLHRATLEVPFGPKHFGFASMLDGTRVFVHRNNGRRPQRLACGSWIAIGSVPIPPYIGEELLLEVEHTPRGFTRESYEPAAEWWITKRDIDTLMAGGKLAYSVKEARNLLCGAHCAETAYGFEWTVLGTCVATSEGDRITFLATEVRAETTFEKRAEVVPRQIAFALPVVARPQQINGTATAPPVAHVPAQKAVKPALPETTRTADAETHTSPTERCVLSKDELRADAGRILVVEYVTIDGKEAGPFAHDPADFESAALASRAIKAQPAGKRIVAYNDRGKIVPLNLKTAKSS